ncbi:HlyD family type I secretion periplasmic adaptor subunit [Sphingomonas sp. MMS12-HWE2-04]|uniref:HlyD family type I secretion periplasmic adaptor subunit n=1 Tax=Sphingomonas sp. MMS12-HWE2-04 TaxID=3234199 RepID=UPI00384DCFAF
MASMADRFPGLARHWHVLRESWRWQNEAVKTARPRSEHEFLPAALEIIEAPPSPGLRWLMLSLCALFVLALLWALIGKMDVVAVATGKSVAAGNAKIIQPIELGGVRAIHVHNGQFVRRGQLLIELDSTLASADEAQSNQALRSAQLVQARNNALLAHLLGRTANFVAPPGTPPAIAQAEATFVRTAIAEYEAQASSLRQQRAEKRAQLHAAQSQIVKLQEAMPFIDKQLTARNDLTNRGYYSKLKLLEYEQARAEHVRDIDVQRAQAAGAQAAIGTIDAELLRLRQTFGKGAATDLTAANDKAGQASEEIRKTERRRRYQELRSPVDGMVQQVAVSTVGGIVQPAQPLMVIVPCAQGRGDDCASAIEVEASVQNKDIGFVHQGQRVAVKLEAFNFTDWGVIEGTVETVSRDSLDPGRDNAESKAGASSAPSSPVYAAKIRLHCNAGDPLRTPLCDRVRPGMSAQTEIKTGRRRIIDYLLSPIAQTVAEAGRER